MNIVNQIVFSHTMYNNGSNRFYLPVDKLEELLAKILESNAANSRIRITPFYINSLLKIQMEFDDYMFYLEVRAELDDSARKAHLAACFEKPYALLSGAELSHGNVFYPLCTAGNVEEYQRAIKAYADNVPLLITRLFDLVQKKVHLTDATIGYGYICFEVHAN